MEEENRKNVNRIKKFIIGAMLFLIFVPLILCIVLFIRIGRLEKKLDTYLDNGTGLGTATVSDPLLAAGTNCSDPVKLIAEEEEEEEELEDATVDRTVAKADAAALNALDKSLEKGGLYKTNLATRTDPATASDATTEEASTEAASTEAEVVKPVPNGHKVYLTFDDGPSKYTNQILDILEEKGVKATFFVVVDDYTYSDELNRIVSDGHTLGMHSMSHKYEVIYKNLNSFKKDVNGVHDLLLDITGVDSKYYRFPGGSSNTVSRVSIDDCIDYLDSQGITYYDWNALNGDAEYVDYSAEELNMNVMGYVHANPGDSMVLLHDQLNHGATVEALPSLIDTLISEGYEIVPIDETTTPVQHGDTSAEE
jgi:peptidoglycan/xylan/chitin deacetylase (PgdA/CDA1 family)